MAYGISYFYRLRSPQKISITLLKMLPKMSPPLLHGALLGILVQLAIISFITRFQRSSFFLALFRPGIAFAASHRLLVGGNNDNTDSRLGSSRREVMVRA